MTAYASGFCPCCHAKPNRIRSWRHGAALLIAGMSMLINPQPSPGLEGRQQEAGLDEILISGDRMSLAAIRKRMVQVEDQFYARYNELNADDLFDIHCEERAATGTRLARRTCRAVFESRAHTDEGREYLVAMQRHLEVDGGGVSMKHEWIAPAGAIVAIEPRREQFRETLRNVTAAHPELAELLRLRAELARHHEQLRRDRFRMGPAERSR